jgi:hypothetical protein
LLLEIQDKLQNDPSRKKHLHPKIPIILLDGKHPISHIPHPILCLSTRRAQLYYRIPLPQKIRVLCMDHQYRISIEPFQNNEL